jgi:hypothetical protein
MTNNQSKLEDLLVSEDDLNEGLLAGGIGDYVRIGENSGAFIPNEQFDQLSANAQTIVALLYQKATFELGLSEAERLPPKEISETTGLNHNTVKGAVRELKNNNLVESEDGAYWVPTYNYQKAVSFIEGAE